MMMATKGAIPPRCSPSPGSSRSSRHFFCGRALPRRCCLVVVSVVIAYCSAPSPEKAKTAEDYGIVYESADRQLEPRTKPGEWLEYSPLLTILISAS